MPLSELNEQLENLYASCCQEELLPLADDPGDLAKALANMVGQIWKDKGMKEGIINKEVTTEFAKRLWGGVEKGYGKNMLTLDYKTPDWMMMASLQRNVWQFSGAKDYTQRRELSNALIDENGKLRTFSQFKEEALKINDKYSKNWLKTEYNLAVRGSQMAGKWVDIEANKEALPLLEFDAVVDDRTTELCLSLNGTVLPVDHPFWDMYYPPNHYNCRSTVRQRRGLAVTTHIPHADIPDMFRTNLGKQGLIYPPGSSYYEGLPEGIAKQSESALTKELSRIARNRLAGKTVEVPELGKVGFNSEGFKELFNQPHEEKMLKNQLVTIANRLLQNATVVASAPDSKGTYKAYHYLHVNGLSKKFTLVVREYFEGKKILYSIVDKLK